MGVLERLLRPHVDYFARRKYFLLNEFSPLPRPVYYRYDGYNVYCPDPNHFACLYDEVVRRNVYGITSGLLNVIDAGANVGMFCLKTHSLNPDCKIMAFEPVPGTFGMLQRNILNNNLLNCTIYPFALAEYPGTVEMTDSEDCGANSIYVDEVQARQTSRRTVNVEARRLSAFVTGEYDLLKVDIEGGEYGVFNDLYNNGKLANFRRIVAEVHFTDSMDYPRLLAQVRESGFRVRIMYTFAYDNDLFIFEAVRR
jgi:FkbM family methyltransferase